MSISINFSTYIVNLKDDIERRLHMEKQCANIGIKPIFIDAVYGLNLSNEEIDNVYIEELAIKLLGRPLIRNEIGCVLSHKKIYKILVQENIDYALIMEDDVEFSDDFLEVVSKLTKNFPRRWDIIALGNIVTPIARVKKSYVNSIKISAFYKLVRPVERFYGTQGYFISQSGARKLIKETQKIFLPADWYTGNPDLLKNYVVSPNLIFHLEQDERNKSRIGQRPFPPPGKHSINKVENISTVKKFLKKFTVLQKINITRVLIQTFIERKIVVFLKQINPFY